MVDSCLRQAFFGLGLPSRELFVKPCPIPSVGTICIIWAVLLNPVHIDRDLAMVKCKMRTVAAEMPRLIEVDRIIVFGDIFGRTGGTY